MLPTQLASEAVVTGYRVCAVMKASLKKMSALIFVVLALSYCGGAAAALCPTSGSTSSINCYRGFTLSATYKALPWCNCTCTPAAAQTFQTYYDYLPVTTQFPCNNATCTNQLSQCFGNYLVSQITYAQMSTDPLNYLTTVPSLSTPDVVGSICMADTTTCSSAYANNVSLANPWCNSAVVGASTSSFDAFAAAFAGDTTPVSDCANMAASVASDPPQLIAAYSRYTCITDKCNAIAPAAISSNAIAIVAHQSVLVSIAAALLAY